MDAFSDLLEDNWTHSPSWERNSPPSDSKQQIPSNTILQPHQRSLFLDFRWLYVNPNIILQWAESLRGQQGTSQSQIQCLNEFFGELKEKKKKKKRPYFPVNTTAWIQWASAPEQKWMPQILKSFWANYYMMIKHARLQFYKWTIMG